MNYFGTQESPLRPKGKVLCLIGCYVLCLVLIETFYLKDAYSQEGFIQTSQAVFQHPDGHAKVVLSDEVSGIFFIFGPAIGIQEFDLSTLPLESGLSVESNGLGESQGLGSTFTHFFLEYDSSQDRYTSLRIGNDLYEVRGGFTIKITPFLGFGQLPAGSGSPNSPPHLVPEIKLTIDNNNPYASLVYESTAARSASQIAGKRFEPAILGFRGNSLVVNNFGDQNVALLSANEFNQYKGIIKPYILAAGQIMLNSKPLSASSGGIARIGVELPPQQNPCLESGARFVRHSQISEVLEEKEKRIRLQRLERLFSKASAMEDQLKGYILLSISDQQIIAYNPATDSVRIIRRLGKSPHYLCQLEDRVLRD